jgi:hypothetical protein
MIGNRVGASTGGHVADVSCCRGDGCTSILQSICECLNMKYIDRHSLFKSKVLPTLVVSQETINDTPLKALSQLTDPANSRHTGNGARHLVVILRHSEMLDVHVLDNLIIQLCDANLDCQVHIVAFTDIMCQLPVQLSQAAQALITTRLLSTASPWDLYESICSRLFSARDIPLVFTPALVAAIRLAFEESDLCVTTAVQRWDALFVYLREVFSRALTLVLADGPYRFKLCLAHHFQDRLSILTMYRETAWLQKVHTTNGKFEHAAHDLNIKTWHFITDEHSIEIRVTVYCQ